MGARWSSSETRTCGRTRDASSLRRRCMLRNRKQSKRRGRPLHRAIAARPEPLESRRMLSAAADAGVWQIVGDAAGRRGPAANDVIVVEPLAGNATQLHATVNGADAGTRDLASLTRVEIFAGRGDDTVSVR